MQHEVLGELAGQRVDALRVTRGAQRGRHQRLGLAPGEQRRAVHSGQHPGADLDLAHRARVATVDARLARQDLAAHDARLDVEQHVVQVDLVECQAVTGECRRGGARHRTRGVRARLLGADLVGVAQRLLGQRDDLGDEVVILVRGGPFPGWLARVAHQLVDRVDRDVALLLAEHDSAQHDLFAELLRLGLHHQDGRFGSGHDQVHLGVQQLGLAGVEHVLAVDVAYAGRTDRAVEGNARNRQRRAGADQRRNVGADLGVQRQHVNDDLNLVVKALREQRTQRPVDQPRRERLELAGATLALEKTAGNLARGVGLFDVVHRQRKEVLPRLGVFGRHDGGQHDGVFDGDDHGAARLAGDFSGLQGDRMLTPLERLGDFMEHAHA